MKYLLWILFILPVGLISQNTTEILQEEWMEEVELNEDEWMSLEKKWNLNKVKLSDLSELNLFTEDQLKSLFDFKEFKGKIENWQQLIHLKGWNLHAIRQLQQICSLEDIFISNNSNKKNSIIWLNTLQDKYVDNKKSVNEMVGDLIRSMLRIKNY